MAQDALGPINPATTSGSQLASRLNNYFDSVKSSFSGTGRPTWAAEGTPYLNKSVSPPVLMLCGAAEDGTQDVPWLVFQKMLVDQLYLADANGFPQPTTLATLLSKLADAGGATSGLDGSRGIVPQPHAGDQNRFLRGDMTYALPDASRFPVVTLSADTTLTTAALTKLHKLTANKTIKLPDGASLQEGDFIDFEGAFAGPATIQRADATSNLIDGATTKTAFAFHQFRLEWSGTAWQTIREVTGIKRALNKVPGDYTLKATDNGRPVIGTASSGTQTISIPLKANEPGVGEGMQVDLVRNGVGEFAIAPLTGVTLNPTDTRRINEQFDTAVLISTSDDVWTLAGSLKV